MQIPASFMYVKDNLLKNSIVYLRDEFDNKISDQHELKILVEQYYFNLLGTSNPSVCSSLVEQLKSKHSFRYI